LTAYVGLKKIAKVRRRREEEEGEGG